jgi:SAM-dependent methyltransferase
VKQGPAVHEVIPLKAITFEGVHLPVPGNPEALLAAIYGPEWEVPNPRFRWDIAQQVTDFFAPMHNYDRGARSDDWDDFYSERSAIARPSQFAALALSRMSADTLVVDLGCGFGRDAEFFARHGHDVLGIDYSVRAVDCDAARAKEEGWSDRAQFGCFDLSDLADVHDALNLIEDLRLGRRVLIYCRFFFDAVDEATEGSSLLLMKEVLNRSLGEALIEFRTFEDAKGEKRQPDPFRRYVNTDDFLRRASEVYGLACRYRVEGLEYATPRDGDARVARVSLARP